MKGTKNLVSTVIVLAMIGMMPGPGAYHAAAQTFGASVKTGRAGGRVSPINLGVGTSHSAFRASFKINNLGSAVLPGVASPKPVIAGVVGVSQALPVADGLATAQNAEAFSWLEYSAVPGAAAFAPEGRRPRSLQEGRGRSGAAVRAADYAESLTGHFKSGPKGVSSLLSLEMPKVRISDLPATKAKTLGRSIMDRILGRKSHSSGYLVANIPVMEAASKGSRGRHSLRRFGSKSRSADMPDVDGTPDSDGLNIDDLDELGNPRRETDPGPDDVYDEFDNSRGGGNSALFGVAATGVMVSMLLSMPPLFLAAIYLTTVVPSLVLHEMGHAKVAERLGDPTPRLEGRLGLSPKSLKSHINPWWTVIVPLALIMSSGFFLAAAEPVELQESNFKNRRIGTLLTALAGPAVNMSLAVAGGLAYLAVGAFALPAVAATILSVFVFMNVMLAAINLLPFFPMDGHHILGSILPESWSAALERFYDRAPAFVKMVPLIVAFIALSPLLVTGIEAVTAFLLSGAAVALGVKAVAGVIALAGWAAVILGGRRGRK